MVTDIESTTCLLLTVLLAAGCATGGTGPGDSEGKSRPDRGRREAPVDVTPTPVAVAAGALHSCARFSDGDVRCWGIGATRSNTRVGFDHGQARPPEGEWSQIRAGAFHTCGLRTDGGVECWGLDDFGQSSPPGGRFTALAGGGFHTCGLRPDGTVACWGLGDDADRREAPGGPATPPIPNFSRSEISGNGENEPANEGRPRLVDESESLDETERSAVDAATGVRRAAALRARAVDRANRRWGFPDVWGERRWFTAPVDRDQADPPEGRFVDLSAGMYHTCGLRPDGEVVCWGLGAAAGPPDHPLDYRQGRPPDGNFEAVASGPGISCGLGHTGKAVRCWGRRTMDLVAFGSAFEPVDVSVGAHHVCIHNDRGRTECQGIVDDTIGRDREMALVPPSAYLTRRRDDSSIRPSVGTDPMPRRVASGAFHVCAVTPDGRLACRGLGDADDGREVGGYDQARPPSVRAVTEVTVGAYQSCVSNGERLSCWGGDTAASSRADESPFFAVRAGGVSTCVGLAEDDGTPRGMRCWQNGPLATTDEPTTWTVGDLETDSSSLRFRDFAVGGHHRCALLTTGRVAGAHCMGRGADGGVWEGPGDLGQAAGPGHPVAEGARLVVGERHGCMIGEESTCWGDRRIAPPDVDFDAGSVVQGPRHGCGLVDGRVRCWGAGRARMRDEGTHDFDQAAPRVRGLPDSDVAFRTLTAGRRYTCGIRRRDSRVVCWGDDSHGQLDAPDARFRRIDAAMLPPQVDGYGWTCGLTDDGRVLCWGATPEQLELPADDWVPEQIDRLGPIVSVAAGGLHTCALDEKGRVGCWGQSRSGQSSPPPDQRFQELAAGVSFTCGLRRDATLSCWGSGVARLSTAALFLGRESLVRTSRDPTAAPPGRYRTVAAGRLHACAVAFDGTIDCWGSNRRAQARAPDGEDFVDVAAAETYSCGLRSNGRVTCWGGRERRSWGSDEEELEQELPEIPDAKFASIAAGRDRTCGIRRGDGSVECFGSAAETAPAGAFGEVTVGGRFACAGGSDRTVECWPLPPASDDDAPSDRHGASRSPGGPFTTLDAGTHHACGVRPDGDVVCWGLGTELREQEGTRDYNQGVAPGRRIRGWRP